MSQSPFKEMSFPLNVYAHALLLEEGRADYLHYGLFQEGVSSVNDAQRYSTELILQQLPPPPCRILEVGCGLGTTLRLLTDKGYQIQGITPDRAQIDYIQTQWSDKAPVSCQKFEQCSAEPGAFDVVLLQESGQYIDPIAIFNQALHFLKAHGSLVILDEFALQPKASVQHPLHDLQDMLAQAPRFGFQLQQQRDLSSYAAPTLAYLLKVTEKHRHRLLTDLCVSDTQLDQLNRSNLCYQDNYAQGYYGYALLHFKKHRVPQWQLRVLTPSCLPDLQRLFAQIFKKTLSTPLWQWKYGAAEARALCVYQDHQLIAHYGGMPRAIVYFGQPQSAVQIGDVMVNPAYRGALTRKGPFFRLAATFIERYIGEGKAFLLGFGFPNARAMQVAEHLGLYARVGQMVKLSWPAVRGRPRLGSTLRVLQAETLASAPDSLDQLWLAMASDLHAHIVGVRDAQYVLSRYCQHPENTYQLLWVTQRGTHKPLGLAVVQLSPDLCEIIDIIAPLRAIALVVHYTQRYAATQQCTQVICQITQCFAHYFSTDDSQCEALDVHIASNIWSDGPRPETINQHWWLMSGDMDYR